MMNFENDLSFFDTMKVFSYNKLALDILPASLDTVRELYPHKPNFDKFAHYRLPVEKLEQDFLELLDLAGLEAKHAEIFYRPGTGKLMDAFIHTDGHRVVPGFAKINYVLGGESNIMKWWKPLKPVTAANMMETSVKTKYLSFKEEDCELYDQVDMQGLYVVNAGIPHSVSMNTGSIDNPRIAISVTPRLKDGASQNVGCVQASYRLAQALSIFSNKHAISS
jgi:hypothetical protein